MQNKKEYQHSLEVLDQGQVCAVFSRDAEGRPNCKQGKDKDRSLWKGFCFLALFQGALPSAFAQTSPGVTQPPSAAFGTSEHRTYSEAGGIAFPETNGLEQMTLAPEFLSVLWFLLGAFVGGIWTRRRWRSVDDGEVE